MALPIQVNPKNPFIDIHTGRGQGSCTFANGFDCICSCAGIALDWLQCIRQSDEAIRGFKLNMLLYELLSLLYSRFVSGVRRPELVRSGRNITMQIIGYMTSHRKQHLEATDVAREFGYGRNISAAYSARRPAKRSKNF